MIHGQVSVIADVFDFDTSNAGLALRSRENELSTWKME